MWMPEIPRDPNNSIINLPSPLNAHGAVTHRTIGHWAGDLAVLTRGRVPSCHFLVGEDAGQWTQMVPTDILANHAAGANSYAVGIEVSGQNGAPFTDWQTTAVTKIVSWLVSTGIPADRYLGDARVTDWYGFIDHLKVEGGPLDHFDYWNPQDWTRVSTVVPPTRKAPLMATSFMLGNQLQAVWVDGAGRPKQEFFTPGGGWAGPADMAPDHPEFKLDAALPLSVQTTTTGGPNLVDVIGRGADGSLVHMWTNSQTPWWSSERFG